MVVVLRFLAHVASIIFGVFGLGLILGVESLLGLVGPGLSLVGIPV